MLTSAKKCSLTERANKMTDNCIAESMGSGNCPQKTNTAEPNVWNKVWMIEHLMDDESLAAEIMELFLLNVPKQILLLKSLLAEGDAHAVRIQSHSIKGAAANIGGERLRDVALKMEEAAKAGELCAAQGYLAELEAEFVQLREEIAN